MPYDPIAGTVVEEPDEKIICKVGGVASRTRNLKVTGDDLESLVSRKGSSRSGSKVGDRV